MVKKITLNISCLHKRHCEKAFSADEAILQRSLTAWALRLFIFAVVFKGIHELNRSVSFAPRNDDLFWSLSMVDVRIFQIHRRVDESIQGRHFDRSGEIFELY